MSNPYFIFVSTWKNRVTINVMTDYMIDDVKEILKNLSRFTEINEKSFAP